MKKAFIFAGLALAGLLGFQYTVSSISVFIQAAYLPNLTYDVAICVTRFILGLFLLISAVAGIVLLAKSFKNKDDSSGCLVPSILLVLAAAMVVLGGLPIQIVECSQGISFYSKYLEDPNLANLNDRNVGVAKSYIAINTLYIFVSVIEASFVSALAILSLVKSNEKKRD